MSDNSNKSLEDFIEEVTNEFEEYENQREVCLSFREHFAKLDGIKVWPEPVIRKQDGIPKFPDLLMKQNDWLILDYKEIATKSLATLNRHLEKMSEYHQSFKLGKTVFDPKDVGIICPMNTAGGFRPILNTIPIIGCKLGKNIKLKHIAGTFKSRELGNIFLNEFSFPLATELNFNRFLRHEPKAISFTAEVVRMALWQLDQTMGGPDIKVTRKQLLKVMSGIYVPYLKGPNVDDFNVEQVSSGRLDAALVFLEKIDFVHIKKAERLLEPQKNHQETVGQHMISNDSSQGGVASQLRGRLIVSVLDSHCRWLGGCQVTDPDQMQIDHRRGDGKEDRLRFGNNEIAMWTYYLTPEHHQEARDNLQPLCYKHHIEKGRQFGDYSFRRESTTLEPPQGVPFHLMFLDDIGQSEMKQRLLTHLLWYLTPDGQDIQEDRLIHEAIKRRIFVDDFEARVTLDKTFGPKQRGTVWWGMLFVSRPGYLQLESRRKFVRHNGVLVPFHKFNKLTDKELSESPLWDDIGLDGETLNPGRG